MKFEKELTLRPVISGYTTVEISSKPKGTPYYEQVLLYDKDYPIAMLHQDTFWPGRRDKTPDNMYEIYDAINNGEQVRLKVTFEVIDEDN